MRKLITFLLALLGLNATTACSENFASVGVDEFDSQIANPDVQLLDVRSEKEYADGHIKNAILIDINDSSFVNQAKAKLDTARTVAIYCRSGRRSAKAASVLTEAGFNVVNLKGGIEAWKKAGKQIIIGKTDDVFTTSRGFRIIITPLIHATLRIDAQDLHIIVDPVTRLGDRVVDYSNTPEPDFIFVTHEHGDHFDPALIKQLRVDNTTIVTNQRCASQLGFGTVMANGDSILPGPLLAVKAIPAYNTTEGHLQFHPQGRDNGYLLNLDGLRIYIAGDTENIPEMANLGPVDIAFLPCNQPYTMTPDQLVKAAKTIQPKVLFPYHFGKTDLTGIAERLKGIDVRIRKQFE